LTRKSPTTFSSSQEKTFHLIVLEGLTTCIPTGAMMREGEKETSFVAFPFGKRVGIGGRSMTNYKNNGEEDSR